MALRKNGITLVTALSEAGGLNPVSQATLTYLRPGDVVQLEIVQVQLSFDICIRGLVIMGAVGASAPMLFKVVGASTHTFLAIFPVIT